jgi:hypothetical protein
MGVGVGKLYAAAQVLLMVQQVLVLILGFYAIMEE